MIKRFMVTAVLLLGCAELSAQSIETVGICDRTQRIQDGILHYLADVADCAEVTSEHLSTITELHLSNSGVNVVKTGDFSGLGNLQLLALSGNGLSTLTSGVFSGLGNLRSLDLSRNDLTALPPGVFSGLGNLGSLDLSRNGLSTLPPDVFSDLGNLFTLRLGFNDLNVLPPELFLGLSRLGSLSLTDNPGAQFAWAPRFSHFAGTESVALNGARFKLTLDRAVPFTIVVGLLAEGGLVTNEARIPQGSTESASLIIERSDRFKSSTVTMTAARWEGRTFADGITIRTGEPLVFTYPSLSVSFDLAVDSMLETKEGSTVNLIVTTSQAPAVDLSVNYRIGDDDDPHTADADDSDYSNLGGGGVTIKANATTTAFSITITDDDDVEPTSESFTVFLTSSPDYLAADSSPVRALVVIREGVCDRTFRLQLRIFSQLSADQIGEQSDCSRVTSDLLSEITILQAERVGGLSAFKTGDLSGLGNLETLVLTNNGLNVLSSDVFSDLGNLRTLTLGGNDLSALPPDVFLSLGNLRRLELRGNNLSTLPPDVFSSLDNLVELELQSNNLRTLPPDVFSNLGNLETLELQFNRLSTLPPGVFSNLGNLETLKLNRNQLSALPPELFLGLGSLNALDMSNNPGVPFTWTPRFSRAAGTEPLAFGATRLKLTLDRAAPFTVAVGLSAEGGSVADEVRIPQGSTESASFIAQTHARLSISTVAMTAVNWVGADSFDGIATGMDEPVVSEWMWPQFVQFDADELAFEAGEGNVVNLIVTVFPSSPIRLSVNYRIEADGDPDTADADESDYSDPGGSIMIEANAAMAIIPITITDDDDAELMKEAFIVRLVAGDDYLIRTPSTALVMIRDGICDRTPQIRDKILQLSAVADCAEVTSEALSGILTVDVERSNIDALKTDDFEGLDNLVELNLSGNNLVALPPDVFSGLGNLQRLDLDDNQLSELPENAFSDLDNLQVLLIRRNRLRTLPTGIFSSLDRIWASVSSPETPGQLRVEDNPGAPFTLGVARFERVDTSRSTPGSAELKLILDSGALTTISISLSAKGGSVSSGMIEIPRGSSESGSFTVTQSSGPPLSVSVAGSEIDPLYSGLRLLSAVPFILDELGPGVSGVEFLSAPPDNAYLSQAREMVTVAVHFDEEVEVTTSTGGPALALRVGASTRTADYDAGLSAARTLVFSYQVAVGDYDEDGIGIGPDALTLEGARIVDVSEDANTAVLTLGSHAIPNAAGHRVLDLEFRLSFEPSVASLTPGESVEASLTLDNAAALSGEVEVAVTASLGLELSPPSVTLSSDQPSAAITVTARSEVANQPALSFESPEVEVEESETAALAVTVVPSPQAAIAVSYGAGRAEDTASAEDYGDPGSGSIMISPGATAAIIRFSISDDDEIEAPRESFTVFLSEDDSAESVTAQASSANARFISGRLAVRVLGRINYFPESSSSTIRVIIKEGVCDRTAPVRNRILNQLDGVTDCADVTGEHLSGIEDLIASGENITAVRPGDFSGLDALQVLSLSFNGLETLPPQVFSGLGSLNELYLHSNNLMVLPPDLFLGLGNLRILLMSGNSGAPFTWIPRFSLASGSEPFAFGAARLKLTLDRVAPFTVAVALSAEGGSVTNNEVRIPQGSTESAPFIVRQSEQFSTVRMTPRWAGRISSNGIAIHKDEPLALEGRARVSVRFWPDEVEIAQGGNVAFTVTLTPALMAGESATVTLTAPDGLSFSGSPVLRLRFDGEETTRYETMISAGADAPLGTALITSALDGSDEFPADEQPSLRVHVVLPQVAVEFGASEVVLIDGAAEDVAVRLRAGHGLQANQEAVLNLRAEGDGLDVTPAQITLTGSNRFGTAVRVSAMGYSDVMGALTVTADSGVRLEEDATLPVRVERLFMLSFDPSSLVETPAIDSTVDVTLTLELGRSVLGAGESVEVELETSEFLGVEPRMVTLTMNSRSETIGVSLKEGAARSQTLTASAATALRNARVTPATLRVPGLTQGAQLRIRVFLEGALE